MSSSAMRGNTSNAASTADKRVSSEAASFCATANWSFKTPNKVFASPARLPCSTCCFDTFARSQIAQVFGSSQVSMTSTFFSEALVDVWVMESRFDSLMAFPDFSWRDCSSIKEFLTETSITSEIFFKAFCLEDEIRSARGALVSSDTPAAKKYSSVTDSGLSTHAGLAPPPEHWARPDKGYPHEPSKQIPATKARIFITNPSSRWLSCTIKRTA